MLFFVYPKIGYQYLYKAMCRLMTDWGLNICFLFQHKLITAHRIFLIHFNIFCRHLAVVVILSYKLHALL